jgi:alkanesulfonate monooxygenase
MPAQSELPAPRAQSELPAPRAQSELPAPRAKFFWFLPTNGDSRSIVGASHASSHHTLPPNYRPPSRRYLAEVARAADRLGYEGVLTPLSCMLVRDPRGSDG